jgi:phosphoadenosine phosphosulfate reductase
MMSAACAPANTWSMPMIVRTGAGGNASLLPLSDVTPAPPIDEQALRELATELPALRADAIVARALVVASNAVMTTNFKPGSAALLHLVSRVKPDIPVIWVDTGYNTPATYRFAAQIVAAFKLKLHVYTPRLSRARFEATHGPLPVSSDVGFSNFVDAIKLEPFERAFAELEPDLWITGIRHGQSDYRDSLGVVSRGPRGCVRVAPIFAWHDDEVRCYLADHAIPDNLDYVDPTKPGDKLECGLQLLR